MGKRLLMNSMDLAIVFKFCKILLYLLHCIVHYMLHFLFASFTDSPGTGLPVSRYDEADL